MANKTLFSSKKELDSAGTTVNEAGGTAYSLSAEQALAQVSVTGCLNGIFYADAKNQLQKVISLAQKVSPVYIARTAIYSRKKGYMKYMPALLCAFLAVKDINILSSIFDTVIDNGKMVRNFVQIIRSGVTGRKSLGSAPRQLVRDWLQKRTCEDLFKASVGNNPSLADIIKMVHPRPSDKSLEALFGYIIGRSYDPSEIPDIVNEFEKFKKGMANTVPDIPFQFLSSLYLTKESWKSIALNAP